MPDDRHRTCYNDDRQAIVMFILRLASKKFANGRWQTKNKENRHLSHENMPDDRQAIVMFILRLASKKFANGRWPNYDRRKERGKSVFKESRLFFNVAIYVCVKRQPSLKHIRAAPLTDAGISRTCRVRIGWKVRVKWNAHFAQSNVFPWISFYFIWSFLLKKEEVILGFLFLPWTLELVLC